MSKKCEISGTGVMTGNNVSHANNKTRRRFLPNLNDTSFFSEALGKIFKLKVSSATLRTIEHNGGLDAYLESTSNTKLTEEATRIKKQIAKKKAATAAA
jgi:large subunit ribosomal protein L28